jgi:phosphonate transport system permease protein
VPATANISAGDTTKIEEHRIYFQQYIPQGGYRLSTNGAYVFKGISETLALALMATTFAVFAAVPLSFLAARNLMTGNPVTIIIYVVARTLLNFVRSIESLIIAIIFVVIVGLGPFAGMLAITVHSIAALAKLYSEVIEGIDPGPIEAIRATGATWVQVVRYGVIPQIVPPFTAFTIYRWDINVRSSTIVGFVGGGGIGFYLIQWIQINDMRAVSASFIAIAVVVVALDYFSARIRERLL